MTTLFDKVWAAVTAEAKVVESDLAGAATTVGTFLTWEEQQLVLLLKPIFAAAEANAVQDLTLFIRGVLTTGQAGKSLEDWETAVMNGLGVLGGELLATATTLGSNALQVVIGLLLAQLPQPKGG